MISCSKAREMIDSYIDGNISEADMTAFEDHISTCDDCRELYEFTIQVTSALKRSIQPPPADFTARVMDRVRQEAAAPVKQNIILPFFRSWKAYGSAAAAVLLLAVIGKTAVYDRYLEVVQPPADTAYVTDAPGIPDVQENQPANQQEKPTENVEKIQEPATQTADVTQKAADSAEQSQPPGLPPNYGAYIGMPSKGGGEPTQPAGAEQPVADMPAQAAIPKIPIEGQMADDIQPPLMKSSLVQDIPEVAQDAGSAAYSAAADLTDEAVGTDSLPEAFCAPAAIPETADSSADTTAGGSSGSRGGGSGGGGTASGGSTKIASAAIVTPKVCHVTIRKSGEGNLLAIQRQLSADIAGSVVRSGDQLIVTVDPADFASTLAELQATGLVESVQTTDSTGGQSVFYIQ